MPKNPGSPRLEYRPWNGDFGSAWQGVAKDGDASSIPKNMLREGINVRPIGGGALKVRGGESKLFAAAFDGTVKGMHDTLFGNGVVGSQQAFGQVYQHDTCTTSASGYLSNGTKLFFVLGTSPCPSPGTGNTTILLAYAPDQSPTVQRIERNISDTTVWGVLGVTEIGGKKVILGVKESLGTPGSSGLGDDVAVILTLNTSPLNVSRLYAWRAGEVANTPSGPFSFVDFDSKFWFSTTVTTGNETHINYFDGTSVVEDRSTVDANQKGAYLAQYREDLIAVYTQNTGRIDTTVYANRCSRRAASSWSDLTLPADVTNFNPCGKPVVYKDKLFIPGSGTLASKVGGTGAILLQLSGTTLTVARDDITAGSAKAEGYVVAVFNGYLYYGVYGTNDAIANTAVLGQYDGTTFTDAHKDLHTQFSLSTWSSIIQMISFRGNLAILARSISYTSTGKTHLFLSPGTSTSGTWTEELVTGPSTTAFQALSSHYESMVVF